MIYVEQSGNQTFNSTWQDSKIANQFQSRFCSRGLLVNEWMNKKSQGFTVDKRRNQRGSPGCRMKKQKIKKNYESIFCSMLQSIDKDVEGGGQAISCWRANCKSRERASFARARARDREREGESHACACSREWRLVLFKEGIIFDAVCIIKSRILRPENAACSISGPSLSYLIAYRDVCYRKAAIHEWNLSPTICQRFERGIVVSSGTICETIAWPGLFCL